MDLQTISLTAAFAANVSVVVSIVFLALQLKASTTAQRASSAWQAENLWAQFNVDVAADPDRTDLVELLLSPDIDLRAVDPLKLRQAGYLARAMFQISQAQFFLYREGSLPKQNWDQERRWLDIFVKFPLVASLMEREVEIQMLTPMFLAELSSSLPSARTSA